MDKFTVRIKKKKSDFQVATQRSWVFVCLCIRLFIYIYSAVLKGARAFQCMAPTATLKLKIFHRPKFTEADLNRPERQQEALGLLCIHAGLLTCISNLTCVS